MSERFDGVSMGGRGADPAMFDNRSPVPLHVLHTRIDYGDRVEVGERESHWLSPAEGLSSRVKRLRDNKTPHTTAGMSVTYTDNLAECVVTLTYRAPEARP